MSSPRLPAELFGCRVRDSMRSWDSLTSARHHMSFQMKKPSKEKWGDGRR